MKKLLLVLMVAVLGCTSSQGNQDAVDACVAACQSALANGTDISAGPCLSNQIADDWVCDVAHSPRQAVDNEPANQCPWFGEGKAHHFVEVDESCSVIQIY